MLDPENAKESILSDLLWTERELKEIVRQAINKVTNKMTFDDGLSPYSTRYIAILAVIHCPGGNQPEVMVAIREHLKGTGVCTMFDNNSSETMLRVWFEVPRWRPLESSL